MKGRLLPNLEVHRSLQAPKSGCSRNPETEQASGHCQVPWHSLITFLKYLHSIVPSAPKESVMWLRVSGETLSSTLSLETKDKQALGITWLRPKLSTEASLRH